MDKIIACFKLIKPIHIEEEKLIREFLSTEVLKKRQHYHELGSVCKKIGFVEKGTLKAVRLKEDGTSYIPYFIQEGHFAVDLDSFITGKKSEEYIEATTDCIIQTISVNSYKKLTNKVRHFSNIMALLTERALIEKNKLKSELLVENAEKRYDIITKRFPSIQQNVSQKDLAAFLGISKYTLNRLK